MTAAADVAALLVTVAGLVGLVVVGLRTGDPRAGLPLLLDLLLAAGLLRLTGTPDLRRAAVAALVVLVRRLAGGALRGVPPRPR